jgi:hypothetical protein
VVRLETLLALAVVQSGSMALDTLAQPQAAAVVLELGGRTLGLMAELLCLIGMAAPDMQEVAYCCLSGEAETRHIPMERQAVAVAAELASMAGMAVFSREAVVLARGLMVDQAA